MNASSRAVLLAAGGLFLTTLLTAPFAPLFDPDEAYYPATAAESIDAGAGWDPRLNGEVRWDKPILAYALIEASFAGFGRGVVAARVPSAAQGMLLILIVGTVVLRLAGAGAAAWSAAVLATTTGVQVFSRVAHPEIGVVLSIVTVELLIVLWLTAPASASSWPIAAAAGVAAGYGVLAKGPVAIVLPGLMVIAMAPFAWRLYLAGGSGHGAPVPRRVVRDLAVALAATIVVAAPWYIAMTWRYGTPFLYEAVWRHNVGRYAGEAFHHDAPVWFYVLPAVVALLPWSALLPAALGRVSRRDHTNAGVLRLAMAAAALTAFAFYSASASKLPHYALVLVPPLAVLIGLYIDGQIARQSSSRTSLRASAIGLAIVGGALAMAPFLIGRVFTVRSLIGGAARADDEILGLLSFAVWPTTAALIAGAIAVWTLRGWKPFAALVVVGGVVPGLLLIAAQPVLRVAYPWERFGRQIAPGPGPIRMIGPRAPSLTFYAGRPVTRIAPDDVKRRPPCADGWLVADRQLLEGPMLSTLCPSMRLEIVDSLGVMALARVTQQHRSKP